MLIKVEKTGPHSMRVTQVNESGTRTREVLSESAPVKTVQETLLRLAREQRVLEGRQ